MNFIKLVFLFLFATLGISLSASAQTGKPVFSVHYAEPTRDKPQSKLWYSHGKWWALLPKTEGPSLWERTDTGWKEHPESVTALTGLQGRCDVWPESDEVTAVGTDRHEIYVLRLTYGKDWEGKKLATLALPEGKAGTMTATIARDSNGHWWIAADVGGSICVWNSKDAITWSQPAIVGDEIKKMEDLCLVTRLPGGIGVIWTDQVKDRVVIREHADSAPPNEWEPETIIEEGNKTADNHLKAALAPDGTLWVATKNSVDGNGKPILVLRVRSAEGKWSNFAYEPLAPGFEQSRPAVYATPNPKVVLLGHMVYNYADKMQNYIEFGLADITSPEILKDKRKVILPEKELNSPSVRNITGPKFPFPADAPWIILAADTKGEIYEADLKTVLPKQSQEAGQSVPVAEIKPRVITEKSLKDTDDPAIWINPQDPSKSLVIGTDKSVDGSLFVYDLEGKIVQRVDGLKRPNNVDVAYGFSLGGKLTDIAVTTEKLEHRFRVYIVPEMRCVDKGDLIVFDGDPKRAPMGIALYKRPKDGAMFAFVGGKSGPKQGYLGQYRLEDDGNGHVKMTLVREFGAFSGRGEIEAIAVDEELGYVYYADELFGIRKYHADPDAPNANEELAAFGKDGFKREREGIAIYKADKGTGYIIVSDQQANQFRIFPREGTSGNPHDHPLLKIVKGETRATDGCDATSVSLSPLFPKGMFVAMSEGKTFHYYAWEDIAGTDLKIKN